jgi:hypothetical protein
MKLIAILLCAGGSLAAQNLSPRWEELTAADFEKAIAKAQYESVGFEHRLCEPGGDVGPGGSAAAGDGTRTLKEPRP